jgi:hypothetical protein
MTLKEKNLDRSLVVLSKYRKRTGSSVKERTWYTLRCYCGRTFEASANNVHAGNTKSCGCRKAWYRQRLKEQAHELITRYEARLEPQAAPQLPAPTLPSDAKPIEPPKLDDFAARLKAMRTKRT